MPERAASSAPDAQREHFARRIDELRGNIVKQWKDEDSYPYEGEATDEIENVNRELFEITAVTVHNANAGFRKSDAAARKFTLRLLREAVEKSPDSLHDILTEVARLDQAQLDDLADLLRTTSLPRLIGAARTITDRLRFLEGLEIPLFDHTKEL